MAAYWETAANSAYDIMFLSNFFLIAPYPDHCPLVSFHIKISWGVVDESLGSIFSKLIFSPTAHSYKDFPLNVILTVFPIKMHRRPMSSHIHEIYICIYIVVL